MKAATRQHTIATQHGSIAVEEAGQGDLTLLMIHGNSSCRGVFRHQMQGSLASRCRMIAFDLPGHGESGNAPDPQHSYTRPMLAEVAVEVLEKFRASRVVVFGWSLGGHIAIDMLPRHNGILGLMITGTPVVSFDNMADGFMGSPHMRAASRQHLTNDEIDGFIGAIFGASAQPFLRAAVARTDGRFRQRLFEAARAGVGIDQRLTIRNSAVPVAVVNGAADSLINLDYVDYVLYGNLWEGRCHRLAGLGHAPFWEAPQVFDPILERFLNDVENGRANKPAASPAAVQA